MITKLVQRKQNSLLPVIHLSDNECGDKVAPPVVFDRLDALFPLNTYGTFHAVKKDAALINGRNS